MFDRKSHHIRELAFDVVDELKVVLAEHLGVPLVTIDKQVLAAFPGRAVAPEQYAEQ